MMDAMLTHCYDQNENLNVHFLDLASLLSPQFDVQ